MKKSIAAAALWIAYLATALWLSIANVGPFRPASRPLFQGGPALPPFGRGPGRFFPWQPGIRAVVLLNWTVTLFFAYLIAFWFSLEIRKDYPKRSAMRLAWNLIAASCAAAMIRYVFEFAMTLSGGPFPLANPLLGLRQIPNVLHSVLLVAGLVAMWVSFSRLRLGVRFLWTDWLAFAAVLAVTPQIRSLQLSLPDSGSAYAAIRFLQDADPLLIIASALTGVVLHRISREIQSGEMATALRYFVAFLILRPLLPVLRLLPGVQALPPVEFLLLGLGRAADWLFTLGVFHRWRFTQNAAELTARYERDPEAEIASGARDMSRESGTSKK
jgi:hypothetical protein